jgi:hypothetical protein
VPMLAAPSLGLALPVPPLLASPLQGEVKGEGGLDDATGTNKFGGGASMKQTSAVVNLTSIREEDDEERVGDGRGGGNASWPQGAVPRGMAAAWSGCRYKQAARCLGRPAGHLGPQGPQLQAAVVGRRQGSKEVRAGWTAQCT